MKSIEHKVRTRFTMKSALRSFLSQPIPFVGREKELNSIMQSFGDPDCRLLTLAGLGGVGKTRLAVEAGTVLADDFSQGAVFVNLQSVDAHEKMIAALADALKFPLSGQDEPQVQIINFLRNKEMLLLLDNFEELLAEIEFISLVLENAPYIKLLVTSRQTLNLQEEWIVPVEGMPYPAENDLGKASEFSAVQLFIRCAQKLRPDFSYENEKEGIVRICQLVDGLPLAIEMSAAWTKMLRCADIADEIQKDIEFLTSNVRNIPPHNHSMRAVIDRSWKLLDQDERAVFMRLSVFRDGFDFQAAREIASATLPILSGLADKSMLRVDDGGRYRIHGLIQQYTANKLEQNQKEALQTRNRFGRYFIEFIHALEGDLVAGRQKEAVLEVKAEIGNIRKAWEWALANNDLNAIEKSVMELSLFYQYQSRYVEGNSALEDAENSLKKLPASKQRDMVLASVLCDLGWLRMRLGNIDQAEQGLLEGMKLKDKHKAQLTLAHGLDPQIPLGVIASIRGDYEKTLQLGKKMLKESQAQGQVWNEQISRYLLTRAAIMKGDLKTAQDHAQKTYQLAKQNRDHWFMAYCLNELGNVTKALGDNSTAKGYFQSSYQLREEFDDPEGMAVALNYLGEIALKEQNSHQAKELFQRSRAIYEDINDRGGLATSLNGLGVVFSMRREYKQAREEFLGALRISTEIHHSSLTTIVMMGIAQLLLELGETREVPQMLSMVSNHPASEPETVEHAHDIAREHKLQLVSEQDESFEEFASRVLIWLPTIELADKAPTVTSPSASPLIDPLTDRELEVLHLIASGSTNQQIADELVISPGTAKWYTSQIYSKLGVKSRTQAIVHAREIGLID